MTIHILSAGSFRAALADLAAAWQGDPITSRCGPAGLLREAIENGEACDLYLSAPADAFLAWLTTPPAQTIIRQHGFLSPDEQE
jgi:hypothetical protein